MHNTGPNCDWHSHLLWEIITTTLTNSWVRTSDPLPNKAIIANILLNHYVVHIHIYFLFLLSSFTFSSVVFSCFVFFTSNGWENTVPPPPPPEGRISMFLYLKKNTSHWPRYSVRELHGLVKGGELDQVGEEDQPGGAHAHHQVEGED